MSRTRCHLDTPAAAQPGCKSMSDVHHEHCQPRVSAVTSMQDLLTNAVRSR